VRQPVAPRVGRDRALAWAPRLCCGHEISNSRPGLGARIVQDREPVTASPPAREAQVPESEAVFVGIDVSKGHLDVAVHGAPEVRRVANDEAGVQALVSELEELRPTLVVLEATVDLAIQLQGELPLWWAGRAAGGGQPCLNGSGRTIAAA
jgi:hypothetical protein